MSASQRGSAAVGRSQSSTPATGSSDRPVEAVNPVDERFSGVVLEFLVFLELTFQLEPLRPQLTQALFESPSIGLGQSLPIGEGKVQVPDWNDLAVDSHRLGERTSQRGARSIELLE